MPLQPLVPLSECTSWDGWAGAHVVLVSESIKKLPVPGDWSLFFCEDKFGVAADGGVTAQRFDGKVALVYQAWLRSDRKPAYVVARPIGTTQDGTTTTLAWLEYVLGRAVVTVEEEMGRDFDEQEKLTFEKGAAAAAAWPLPPGRFCLAASAWSHLLLLLMSLPLPPARRPTIDDPGAHRVPSHPPTSVLRGRR